MYDFNLNGTQIQKALHRQPVGPKYTPHIPNIIRHVHLFKKNTHENVYMQVHIKELSYCLVFRTACWHMQ